MPTLPLGAVSVASAVQETLRHIVKIFDLPSDEPAEKNLTPLINDFKPDFIAISVRNIDDQNIANPSFLLDSYRDVVSACRKLSQAPLILGGPGYSLFPDEIFSYLDADFAISGEGEILLPLLLENIHNRTLLSQMPNLLIKGMQTSKKTYRPAKISALPAIDPLLWPCPPEKRADIFLPLQSRRGCPFNCTYCPNSLIEGCTLRQISPEMFVENIVRHVESGYNKFYFTDNVFNLPLSYSKELCRCIVKSNVDISWVCSVYPFKADEELAELMAQAGCKEINLSFESGSKIVLEKMNKRFSKDDVIEISNLFRKQSINRTGFVLLGGPGETEQTAEETLEFSDSLELEAVNLTIGMRIYPGTVLSKIALKDGFLRAGGSLLRPIFYLEKALGDWIFDKTEYWLKGRSNWRCQLFR